MVFGKRASATAIILSSIVVALIICSHLGLIPVLEPYTIPLLILFATIIIARVIKQAVHAHLTRAASKMRAYDKTRYALFGKLVSVIIWLTGLGVIVSMIPALRTASISLFAGAGVLAVIIGFATQKPLGNIASGIFIATFQPYRIGDRLIVMGERGKITDINLRHTTIETWDNRRIIIPNSRMDDEVIDNHTIGDPAILGTLDIGISYDSDIDLARSIMEETALMHPDFFDNKRHKNMLASDEKVKVRLVEAEDSAIILRLYYWAYDEPTNTRMKADLFETIKKRFDKEGVEIPFPYRTLVYKNDLEKPKQAQKKSARKRSKKKR